MSLKKKLGVFFILMVCPLLLWAGGTEEQKVQEATTVEAKRPEIGYIVLKLDNDYWITVKEAAEAQAEKLNVELTFFGGDVIDQLAAIDDMISKGVDAVIISAQDSEGIVPGIRRLNEAQIPVIGADILPNAGEMIATVQTDPVEGGRLLGEFMLEKKGKNGKLFVMETFTYIEVITNRQQAAVDVLEPEGWTVIRQPVVPYGRDKAKELTETVILGNPDLSAVYAVNDDTALGSQLAVEALGRENEILVIGFDAIDEAVESIDQGRMDASIYQDCKLIARWAIEQCVAYLQDPWTETIVYAIPSVLVTTDDVKEFKQNYMTK